jgi:hypothetical protein
MGERIPPLLRRRIELLKGTDHEMAPEIYERAVSGQAVFDRVLVWQVPEAWYAGETFEGTGIVKAVSTQKRQEYDTPRGIIVSAGLNALDVLRSQGMDVGHVVHFMVNSLYRRPLDDHDEKHLALMRVGDIVDSEDLAQALDRGECRIDVVQGKHRIADKSGLTWVPQLPWMES